MGRAGAREEEQVQGERRPLEFTLDSEVTPRIVGGRNLEGGIGSGCQSKIQGRRLEMLIFERENPDEWIFK